MNARNVAIILCFLCTSTHLFGTASKALLQAVQSDENEAVASALQQGANFLSRIRGGRTPLHIAAFRGNVIATKLLLDSITNAAQRREYLECKDRVWKTALHAASEEGHLPVVNVLIDYGSNPFAQDEDNNTPLHLAARGGHHHVVWYLVAMCRVDPNMQNQSRNTPLHIAIAQGNTRIVRYLINEADASIEAVNRSGWKPIHCAAAYNRCTIMLMLIGKIKKQRQAISLGNTPFTRLGNPLHIAIHAEHASMAALLVEATDEYTDEKNRRGDTPLHLAARNSDPTLARLLMQGGAVCEQKDACNRTPADIFFIFPLESMKRFHGFTNTQHILPAVHFWLALAGEIGADSAKVLDNAFPNWRAYLAQREQVAHEVMLEFVSVKDLRNLIILFAGPHYPSQSTRPEKRPRRA